MDLEKAQALSFEVLLRTAMCRCMEARCARLHYADLSDDQQGQLERHWDRVVVEGPGVSAEPAGWDIGRVFAACVEHRELRALVVFKRTARYAEVFREVRRLLVPDIDVEMTARGHVLRFPHGSVLRMLVLDSARAVRVLGGVEAHLAVFDGLDEEDVAYVASRVRSADVGLRPLGAHPLAVE